jgi:Ni/Fe-hydrogenase subunit HybB-like protein
MNWAMVSAAFMVVMAVALGGILLSALLHLANARRNTWRLDVVPYAHRVVHLYPLALVLLVVLLAVPQATFPWYGQTSRHINVWHNYPFLVVRELLMFGLVVGVNLAFVWVSDTHAREGTEATRKLLTYFAAAVVTLFVFYTTLLAWDFEMTLTPGWRSSMYAPNFFISAFQAFLAIFVVSMFVLRVASRGERGICDASFNALAQMMLGFTLFWIYTFFGQFLTIWYAALPEETHRVYLMLFEDGDIRREPSDISVLFWWFLFLKSFVPFLMLIFFAVRHVPALTVIPALAIVVGTCLERFTWVAPTHRTWNLPLTTWFDITVAVLVSGAFFVLLRAGFQRAPARAP